jgi:lycopene cyclase domain-containing protein
MLPMLILTAVFDNLIILAGIVGYDETKILGISIGVAPIEDFAYTVVAVLLVPAIWKAASK